MEAFNWADWVIIGVLGLSTLTGIIRGFVRESIALATWVLALFIAYKTYEDFSSVFTTISTPILKQSISFFLIFMSILIGGGLLNFWLSKMVRWTGFGWVDRTVGLFFGIGRGALFILFLIICAMPTEEEWFTKSYFIPKIEPYTEKIMAKIPEDLMKKFEELEKMF